MPQPRWPALVSALLSLALVACGSGSESPGEPVVDPATLCVASSCGTKTRLLDIPSAENLFFTDDGRLFVTGDNVYEVTRTAAGWQATPLSATGGSYTGLAQIGDVLYANSFDGGFHAARLTAVPQLQQIRDTGVGGANGLVAGPEGELYLTGSYARKIVRLRLDPADPLKVAEQEDWLSTGALTLPNGLQRRGRTLLFSASEVLPPQLGFIRGVAIQPDGTPGEPQLVARLPGIPDDFSVVGDALLAAVYSNNQIVLVGADGSILSQTNLLSFDNPSQVRVGRPPLFTPDELLVTEKGLILLPPTPGYGSKLSVFRRNDR